MKRSILKWELIGIVVISILGSVLHFVFEWAGNWAPVGVIAAVNESVWEHLKLAFWPALFYAIFEYLLLRRAAKNFMLAKAAGIFVMPIVIAIIFYSYTAIIGHEILIVDISSFFVAVALGQLVSYKILTMRRLPAWLDETGLALVIVLAIAYVMFTFYPPHLPIFRDAVSGGYGIIK